MTTRRPRSVAERLQEQAAAGNGRNRPVVEPYPEAQRGDAWEGDHTVGDLPKPSGQGAQTASNTFRWEPLDSAAFATADYHPTWLCKRVLVANQPAIIGGPQKVLKTTVALDLAVCLASAMPWLGEFACPARKRVAVLSGESGPFTLQETARRICAAKRIELAAIKDTLSWQFTLPQLANLQDLDTLRTGLARDAVDVTVIDPLYLSLLAGGDGAARAENLYETGPLLLRIAQACTSAGATPVLLHHTRKGAGRQGEPLDLTDLAFSGVAEFARQWVLLSRREPFEPGSGVHRLWLRVGGSVGHGGQWALDVDEGQLAEDFTGRKWQTAVKGAAEVRQQEKEQKVCAKDEQRRQRDKADETSLLAALNQLAANNGEAPYGRVRDLAGLSRDRMSGAFERLIAAKAVERCSVKVEIGNKAKRPVVGIRRLPEEGAQPTLLGTWET